MNHQCVYQPRAVAVGWTVMDAANAVNSLTDARETRDDFPPVESITYKACACGKVLL